MRQMFFAILDNVWVASIMILVVVLIRIFMKKIPKFIYPLLWGLVGLKLLSPFDIRSSLGLLPSSKIVEYGSQEQAPVIIRTGLNIVDDGIDSYISNNAQASAPIDKGIGFLDVCIFLWLAGIFVLVLYMLVSYIVIRKKVSQSINIEERVSICDEINSPFLLGVIKPQIFIPSGIKKDKYDYILTHEKMHIKRGDHLWKPLGFLLLSIYWFNPFCWIAYYLFCKDVELACDEKVISKRDSLWKANYCQTLLECSTDTGKMIFAPLGFGEIGVKERIKKIMVYKKTKLGVVILAIVICGIIVICFGTRKKVSDASKNSAGQEKTVAKEKDSTKQDEIIGQKPVVDVNTSSGADGTQLYYGDENKIIFGGYYGLFVYDTENQKYIQSVDLKTIGCNMTQGDGAVEIMVKKGGEVVYLHKMSDKENMYEYSVENNTFVKKKYNLDKKALYHGATTDNGYVEARFKTKKGKVNSYIFVNNYLNLGELAYRRIGQDIEEKDDLVFPLFVEEHLRSASYFTSSDVYNIVRAEIEYDGKHYVCKNKKVLADIEKGYANAQKGKGLSACPFTYVMYLTRKDGVIGMVIPAMDSCKACVMGDGWYEQDNSLSMSIYDMIEKGWFKAE